MEYFEKKIVASLKGEGAILTSRRYDYKSYLRCDVNAPASLQAGWFSNIRFPLMPPRFSVQI